MQCASSKWNFSNVNPGLVGGHCIGVDTYYLLQRAKEKGQSMELVEKARNINEMEPQKIADRIQVLANKFGAKRILLLGLSYKANTPDCRNSKVVNVYEVLKKNFSVVDCFDPIADRKMARRDFGIKMISKDKLKAGYDLVVKMVNHKIFDDMDDFVGTKIIELKDLL